MKILIRIISWLPSQVLRLSKGYTSHYASALVITYLLGLVKGYSFSNLAFMLNQISLETASGTSNAITSYNNTNGMNCVAIRPTTQTSCTDNEESLGIYNDIYDSCVDRFIWDNYWGFDLAKSDDDYPNQVCTKYHTSPTYLPSVNSLGLSVAKFVRVIVLIVVPLEILLPFFISIKILK